MTTTQAQIEAAAAAMREVGDCALPMSRWEVYATAALTAAAEVGRGCGCLHVSRHGHQDDCELTAVGVPEQEHIPQKPGQKAGLLPSGNTAAEVGEQDELESGVLLTKAINEVIAEDIEKEQLQELVSQGIQIERQLRKELLTLGAATIERCAQVANGCWTGAEAAVRIRALKDRP